MCWRHRGNSQGDQYSWSTSGEGDSGRKVGWRWPTAWPYGSCRSFQKLQSLLRGQWQVRKRLTRNKCHHLTWFLKDHSESPVNVKPKGVKETVRRLFKRPVGKGIYRPLKTGEESCSDLMDNSETKCQIWSHFSAPVLLSLLLSRSGLLLHFHKQLQDLWPERKDFFLSEPGWNPRWGAWPDHGAILRPTGHSLCPLLCLWPRGWGAVSMPGRSSRIKYSFSVAFFFFKIRQSTLWTQQKDEIARERLKMVSHLMEASPSDFSFFDFCHKAPGPLCTYRWSPMSLY